MLTFPWTRRPPRNTPLHYSHPLAKGMVGCFHLDYGLAYNLVSGAALTQVGTPGLSAADGPARTFLNNDSQYFTVTGDAASASPFNFLADFTVLTTHYELDTASTQQPVSRIHASLGGWNVQFNPNTSGGLYLTYLEYVEATIPTFRAVGMYCRQPAQINHICWAVNATSGVIRCYANGLTGFTTTGDPTTGYPGLTGTAFIPLTIGTDADPLQTRGCTNPLSRVVLWNRTLTPAEMALVTTPQTAYAYMQPLWLPTQGAQAASGPGTAQTLLTTRHVPTPVWRVG